MASVPWSYPHQLLLYWLGLQQLTPDANALTLDVLTALKAEERERLVTDTQECLTAIRRVHRMLLAKRR